MSVTLDLVNDPVTTREAAALLQISLSAVQKAISRGHLPAERMGRDKFIEREIVERYRRERKMTGPRQNRPTPPPT